METMTTKTDYNKQAADLLESFGVDFRAELIGDDCPRLCKDPWKAGILKQFPRKTHIHGKHYRIVMERRKVTGKGTDDKRPLVLDFWNSYADEEYNALKGYWEHRAKCKPWTKINNDGITVTGRWNKIPVPYDVLACIQKSDVGSFENFCGDFGYDTDSRQAYDMYLAVQDEYARVSAFFTSEELRQLEEVQ